MIQTSALSATFYIACAGFCFMLANLIMKTLAGMPIYVLYPAITVTAAVGFWCEIEALKTLQFGFAVAFLLVAEMLFSFVIAILFLREGYSSVNFMGVALMIGGMILLNSPAEIANEQPAPNGAKTVASDTR